jgi:hypothetical protein
MPGLDEDCVKTDEGRMRRRRRMEARATPVTLIGGVESYPLVEPRRVRFVGHTVTVIVNWPQLLKR